MYINSQIGFQLIQKFALGKFALKRSIMLLKSCFYCQVSCQNWVCELCLSELVRRSHEPQFSKYKYFTSCMSLFNWIEEPSNIIGKLIYYLKENREPKPFGVLSHLMVKKWILKNDIFDFNKALWVPAPSRLGQPDHASMWAFALRGRLGGDIFLGLSRKYSGSQEKRRRLQRFHQEVKVTGLLPPKDRKILFVDDVITTGATAMAIYRALGRPKSFQIVSIACRGGQRLL